MARILVVDDDPNIREVLQTYFQRSGYEVASASSVQLAKTQVQETPPDLVVLDIDLGEGDGLEALEQIKQLRPDLRVVMMTGMGFDEDLLQEARRKGADGYLSKHLPVDQLLMEVKRVLRSDGGK